MSIIILLNTISRDVVLSYNKYFITKILKNLTKESPSKKMTSALSEKWKNVNQSISTKISFFARVHTVIWVLRKENREGNTIQSITFLPTGYDMLSTVLSTHCVLKSDNLQYNKVG